MMLAAQFARPERSLLSTMALTRRTLAELGRALAAVYDRSEFGALFFEFDVESSDPRGARLGRAIGLIKALESTNDKDTFSREILGLTERTLNVGAYQHETLIAYLRIDGYEYTNNRLVPTTPSPAALGPELSALEKRLEVLPSEAAASHYRQAVDNFVDRNWEACNSQIRSFVEDLMIAVSRSHTGKERGDPVAALQDLKTSEYLDDAEFNQFKAFWQGIQDKGPHRGLSDEAEALFRLHMATTIASYLLSKNDN
jgi:hypothetical protein